MTNETRTTWEAAQDAIAGGQTDKARQLLQRCARENPSDYRPWLWMAGLAKSEQQSLAYLDRAEQLNPGDPAIQKARLWSEQHFGPDTESSASEKTVATAAAAATAAATAVTTSTYAKSQERIRRTAKRRRAAAPQPAQSASANSNSRRSWMMAGAMLLIVVLLLGAVSLLLSNGDFISTALASAPTATYTPPEVKIVAEIDEEKLIPPVEETEEASSLSPEALTPTPAASETSLFPTPTLQPTFTPAPTATPAPTVIVNTGGENILETVSVVEGEHWVDVNLSSQLLTAYEGDVPVYSTLISSGLSQHPTVTGQFRIWMRYESQTMNGYLLGYDYYLEDVPYVMYFYNDYALHGAYWHNNFGTPMSHGCVNLSPDDAAWVFGFTTIGTLVNVHY